MINELPMKISNSDKALTPDENNLFEKGNRKSQVLKKNWRVPYFSSKKNVCGQESDTGYSSNGRGIINED